MQTLLETIKHYPTYSLTDLFKIRDALYILYDYGLADTDLLVETLKAIKQYEGRIVW